ncbi:septation protein IspZ [Aeromonas allosaccharophila]
MDSIETFSFLYSCRCFVIIAIESSKRSIVFSLGNRLGLADIIWCSYRKVMGTFYIIYAAILYVVSVTLPLTYWVYTKIYGSLFVNFVLSILVGVIVTQKNRTKI